jgi:transposase-like protein
MPKPLCPFCGFCRSWTIRRKRRKCKKCRREFGELIYPIRGFRATESEWLESIGTFLRERTIKRVAEENRRSHYLAERIVMRLRQAMSREAIPTLNGPIELDETYIGGQRKNKRLHIRRIKAKRGHGTDKLPIVGFFDRATGRIIVYVEPRKLDLSFIIKTLKENVAPGATVYTDGFKMYRQIPKYGFEHSYVDHDHDELVRGDIHTNNIEGFWGILKRKLSCIGGMQRKYLPLFVAELVWKFNHRRLSFKEQKQALWKLVSDA